MAYKISKELDEVMESLVGSDKNLIYGQVGQPLPNTIRFNPLKGPQSALAEFLQEQGFQFQAVEGFDNIFRIKYQPYPIGKSVSHFLGHIYVQDMASMMPPIILDPQPGEWVLDMSAAPGSKTTQLAAMMQNRGLIIANDIVLKRLRSLSSNLERMGVANTAIFKWQGEQFGNQYFEVFDRVLLDPACSGLGTLHKSPEVLAWWTPAHCQRMAAGQKRLITSAIKALRPGGILCYSTCTLTPEENEEVIDFALEKFPVELENISLPSLKTRPGLTRYRERKYHSTLDRALRFYPFESDSEGFFVARLRKTAAMEPPRLKKARYEVRMPFLTAKTSPVKKYLDYLCAHFAIPARVLADFIYIFQRNIVFASRDMSTFPFLSRPLQGGLVGARPMDRGAKFTTGGAQLLGHLAEKMVLELPDLYSLEQFVNRKSLQLPVKGTGQVIIKYKGMVIGYGLADRGHLKSQFPKAEWPFKPAQSNSIE